jgi:glycosyltransferase involved in cell wall biosynthesis
MSLRLLFATQCEPSLELGGSKTQLELAAALEPLGWRVDVLQAAAARERHDLLNQLDVADWDVNHCIPRSLLPAGCLSVARIPLLSLQLRRPDPWPHPLPGVLQRPWQLLRGACGRSNSYAFLARSRRQVEDAIVEADLLNPWNSADQALLLRRGIQPERLVLLPPGLTPDRRAELAATAMPTAAEPAVVAFVGTFDFRKGGLDLPRILLRLQSHRPGVRLRLIGTRGLYRTEEEVRRFFPARLQRQLDVVPAFAAAELPQLLAGVHAGVFPSYLEGFGIAVLEQLAAGIPVAAYDVPGPCDSLPPQWLVPRGDWRSLADRVLEFLPQDPAQAAALRQQALGQAERFCWSHLARQWDQVYRQALASHRHEPIHG